MSHPKQVILKDSRGRIVQATIANDKHDGQTHFACWFCDGDFLSLHSCKAHIEISHSTTTTTESNSKPIVKMETISIKMDVGDIVEISDDELETISIASDEPEEVEPSTSTSSTGNKQMTSETLVNGKHSSNENQTTQQQIPSTSKDSNATNEESDDDVSVSSIESQPPENGSRTQNAPNGNNNQSEEDYSCDYCPESFPTFDEYLRHRYSCEAWRKSMFSCPVKGCPKRYANRSSRDDHVDKKHANYGFPCGICKRRFLSEKQKRQHQIAMHSRNDEIPCGFCKRIFFSNYQRNCHVKRDHEYGEYECPVCDHSFKTKKAMLDHKKEVHPKK